MRKTMYSSQMTSCGALSSRVWQQLLVKMRSLTLLYVFSRRSLVILYRGFSIFAFRREMCLRPGLQALLCPYPNLVSYLISWWSECRPNSPRLFCLLSQRGTHHCLLELYTRLSPTSVSAFISLKAPSTLCIIMRAVLNVRVEKRGFQCDAASWTPLRSGTISDCRSLLHQQLQGTKARRLSPRDDSIRFR